MRKLKISIVLLFAASAIFYAQEKIDYSTEPGYFNFDELVNLKNAELINEIDIESPLLKMMAGMFEEEKKGSLGEKINVLKLIRVKEYNIEKKDFGNIEASIESMDKELQTKKWERVIRTKSKTNFTNVYVRRDSKDQYVGLVVTSLDKEGKATFVNIVGELDLETIGKMSKELNIPQLDKVKKEK